MTILDDVKRALGMKGSRKRRRRNPSNPGDWPSIDSLAHDLKAEKEALRRMFTRREAENEWDEEGGAGGYVDVRLQVVPDEGWALHTGISDYDQDHRGHWGADSLRVYGRQNLRELARDLIRQARDDAAQW